MARGRAILLAAVGDLTSGVCSRSRMPYRVKPVLLSRRWLLSSSSIALAHLGPGEPGGAGLWQGLCGCSSSSLPSTWSGSSLSEPSLWKPWCVEAGRSGEQRPEEPKGEWSGERNGVRMLILVSSLESRRRKVVSSPWIQELPKLFPKPPCVGLRLTARLLPSLVATPLSGATKGGTVSKAPKYEKLTEGPAFGGMCGVIGVGA